MDIILSLLSNILEEGFLYAVMACGVYVTYRVLNFPDLSVDGTFPLGACVTGALIVRGADPFLAALVSLLCGAAAGCVTGLLHVKLHITDLLSGILVMTGLTSINLVVTGGTAMLAFYNRPTVFSKGPAALVPDRTLRILLTAFLFCLAVRAIVGWYLHTKSGLLLRAAGDNPQFAVSLGRDPGAMKILGLMIGNGLTALSGSLLSQQAGSANVWSGTGMVVMALASVIIGISLFGRIRFLKPLADVILGTIVYRACLAVAMQLGLPADYLKLLMAVLFTLALIANRTAPSLKGKEGKNAG